MKVILTATQRSRFFGIDNDLDDLFISWKKDQPPKCNPWENSNAELFSKFIKDQYNVDILHEKNNAVLVGPEFQITIILLLI